MYNSPTARGVRSWERYRTGGGTAGGASCSRGSGSKHIRDRKRGAPFEGSGDWKRGRRGGGNFAAGTAERSPRRARRFRYSCSRSAPLQASAEMGRQKSSLGGRGHRRANGTTTTPSSTRPTMNTGPSARTASSPAGSKENDGSHRGPCASGGTKYYVRLAFQNEPEFIRAFSDGPNTTSKLPSVDPATASKVGGASDITFFTAKFTGRENPPNPDPAFDAHCRRRIRLRSRIPAPRRDSEAVHLRPRGTFTLTFHGEKTKPILLSSTKPRSRRNLKRWPISDRAMSSVTGGAGDFQASHPYFIEFTGRLRISGRRTDARRRRARGKALGDAYLETIAPATAKKNSTVHRGLPAPPRPSRQPSGKEPVEMELNNRAVPQHDLPRPPGGRERPGKENFTPPNFTVFDPQADGDDEPGKNGSSAVEHHVEGRSEGHPDHAPGSIARPTTASVGRSLPTRDNQNFPGPLWCEACTAATTTPAANRSSAIFSTQELRGRKPNRTSTATSGSTAGTNYIVRIGAPRSAAAPAPRPRSRQDEMAPAGGPDPERDRRADGTRAECQGQPQETHSTFHSRVEEGEDDENYKHSSRSGPKAWRSPTTRCIWSRRRIEGLEPETTYRFRVARHQHPRRWWGGGRLDLCHNERRGTRAKTKATGRSNSSPRR